MTDERSYGDYAYYPGRLGINIYRQGSQWAKNIAHRGFCRRRHDLRRESEETFNHDLFYYGRHHWTALHTTKKRRKLTA